MIQRVAILAASLVAAAGLAVGLVVAGIAPAAAPVAAEPVSAPVVAATDAPQPVVQVDTVYVAPQVEPASAAPPAPSQDEILAQLVKAYLEGDDDEGESEGWDD
jgi:hypothetical protein